MPRRKPLTKRLLAKIRAAIATIRARRQKVPKPLRQAENIAQRAPPPLPRSERRREPPTTPGDAPAEAEAPPTEPRRAEAPPTEPRRGRAPPRDEFTNFERAPRRGDGRYTYATYFSAAGSIGAVDIGATDPYGFYVNRDRAPRGHEDAPGAWYSRQSTLLGAVRFEGVIPLSEMIAGMNRALNLSRGEDFRDVYPRWDYRYNVTEFFLGGSPVDIVEKEGHSG